MINSVIYGVLLLHRAAAKCIPRVSSSFPGSMFPILVKFINANYREEEERRRGALPRRMYHCTLDLWSYGSVSATSLTISPGRKGPARAVYSGELGGRGSVSVNVCVCMSVCMCLFVYAAVPLCVSTHRCVRVYL